MTRLSAVLLIASLVAAIFPTAVVSDKLPISQCLANYNDLGQTGVGIRLLPCAGVLGPKHPKCCWAAQQLLGYDNGGKLAGCLCYPVAYVLAKNNLDADQTSQLLHFDSNKLEYVLDYCGVAHYGGTDKAACPKSAPVALTSVAVTVPSKAAAAASKRSLEETTVTAPYTTVKINGKSSKTVTKESVSKTSFTHDFPPFPPYPSLLEYKIDLLTHKLPPAPPKPPVPPPSPFVHPLIPLLEWKKDLLTHQFPPAPPAAPPSPFVHPLEALLEKKEELLSGK